MKVVQIGEDELARLRRDNRELREEVEEWRRREQEKHRRYADDARYEAARGFLRACWPVQPGLMGGGPTKALLALLDARGCVVRRETLAEITIPDLDASPDGGINQVKVYVCRLRAALRNWSDDAEIETAWATGYRLSGPVAASIDSEIERRLG